MPVVVALAADLLFASRIQGTAGALGVRAEAFTRVEPLVARALEARPALVLIDLEARGLDVPSLIRRLRTEPALRHARIMGFVSHMNAGAAAAARNAGADRVLARSAFVEELPRLLGMAQE
ncbi:MAG: hypothetical protein ACRELD_04190 [Longimicrobiales bacterium]